jgi:hypothetical protein
MANPIEVGCNWCSKKMGRIDSAEILNTSSRTSKPFGILLFVLLLAGFKPGQEQYADLIPAG